MHLIERNEILRHKWIHTYAIRNCHLAEWRTSICFNYIDKKINNETYTRMYTLIDQLDSKNNNLIYSADRCSKRFRRW